MPILPFVVDEWVVGAVLGDNPGNPNDAKEVLKSLESEPHYQIVVDNAGDVFLRYFERVMRSTNRTPGVVDLVTNWINVFQGNSQRQYYLNRDEKNPIIIAVLDHIGFHRDDYLWVLVACCVPVNDRRVISEDSHFIVNHRVFLNRIFNIDVLELTQYLASY